MRRLVQCVVVVCLLSLTLSALGAPRDSKAGDIVKRVVKKIRALGDLLTIPGA